MRIPNESVSRHGCAEIFHFVKLRIEEVFHPWREAAV